MTHNFVVYNKRWLEFIVVHYSYKCVLRRPGPKQQLDVAAGRDHTGRQAGKRWQVNKQKRVDRQAGRQPDERTIVD